MAFRSFQISMRILCLSNHLGRSFSLYLLVHFVKTYENEWSPCLNDQFAKTYILRKFVGLLCNVVQLSILTPSVVCAALIVKSSMKEKKNCIPNG